MFSNFSIQMPGEDVRLAMMKVHADLDSHLQIMASLILRSGPTA
jgi:hypothetical protein